METVKKKFRELAKEMHPDTGGSIEEFLALYEAYELFKRKRY
jgi:curved DNA-binding protein CbpA